MSHPGNDFILDLARDEMEDGPEISRGKVKHEFGQVLGFIFGDEGTRIPSQHLEKIELERLFEEAVGGIIILRDAVDDAISVLDRNFKSGPKRIDTLDELAQQEMFELLQRLKHIRKTMEESK